MAIARVLFVPLLLIAAAPASPMAGLAGRYTDRFVDPRDGSRQEDVVEIVPVDAGHAYVRIGLFFPNGFNCGLDAVAALRGRTLVYRAPRPEPETGRQCVLRIRREGDELTLDDGANSCKSACGMNGEMTDTLPWRSRRPIADAARIRRSPAYRAAVRAWRAGRPADL